MWKIDNRGLKLYAPFPKILASETCLYWSSYNWENISMHKTLPWASSITERWQTKELVSWMLLRGWVQAVGRAHCPWESGQNECGAEVKRRKGEVPGMYQQAIRMRTLSESLHVLCGLKTYKPSSIPDPPLKAASGSGSLTDVVPQTTGWLKTPLSLGQVWERPLLKGGVQNLLRDPEALGAMGEGSREVEVL